MGERAFHTGYDDGPMIKGYKTDIGAFEIYFMGVRLFSKLICNKWPRVTLVVQKCEEIYSSFHNLTLTDKDIIDEFDF